MPSERAMKKAALLANWGQVVGHGGPPCFHIEDGRFCFRSVRWGMHNGLHKYVSLDEVLDAERWAGMEEAAKIAFDRRKLYVGSAHQIYRTAHSMCEIISASIRTKIEAEKKEAGR